MKEGTTRRIAMILLVFVLSPGCPGTVQAKSIQIQ